MQIATRTEFFGGDAGLLQLENHCFDPLDALGQSNRRCERLSGTFSSRQGPQLRSLSQFFILRLLQSAASQPFDSDLLYGIGGGRLLFGLSVRLLFSIQTNSTISMCVEQSGDERKASARLFSACSRHQQVADHVSLLPADRGVS